MSQIKQNILSGLSNRPAYAGWQPDEIEANVRDVLASGNATRVNNLSGDLASLGVALGDVQGAFAATPSPAPPPSATTQGGRPGAVAPAEPMTFAPVNVMNTDYSPTLGQITTAESPTGNMPKGVQSYNKALAGAGLMDAPRAPVSAESDFVKVAAPASSTSTRGGQPFPITPYYNPDAQLPESVLKQAGKPKPEPEPTPKPKKGYNRFDAERNVLQNAGLGYNATDRMEFEPVETKDSLSDEEYKNLRTDPLNRGFDEAVTRPAAAVTGALGDMYLNQERARDEGFAERVEAGMKVAEGLKLDLSKVQFQGENPVMAGLNLKGVPQTDRENLYTYLTHIGEQSLKASGQRMKDFAGALNEGTERRNPLWMRADHYQTKLAEIEKRLPGVARSWGLGDITGMTDILVADAFMSGNKEYQDMALRLQGAAGNAQAADANNRTGWADTLLNETVAMLPMMGRSALMQAGKAVPFAGFALGPLGNIMSTSMWARQGMGDILGRIAEQGGDPSEAVPLAMAAGLAYAMIENVQVGQVFSSGAKKAAGPIWSRILQIAKNKGKDFINENLEEVVQDIVTYDAVRDALARQGIEYDPMTIGERIKETLKGTAGPMGVLSLAGLGAGVAKTGINEARNRNAQAQAAQQGATARVAPTTTGQGTQFAGRGVLPKTPDDERAITYEMDAKEKKRVRDARRQAIADGRMTKEDYEAIDAGKRPPDTQFAQRGSDRRTIDDRRGEETDLSVEDEAQERLLNEHYEKLEREEKERMARGEPPKAERPHVDWTQKDADLGGIIAQQNARVEQFAPVREQLLTPTIGAYGEKILNGISDPNEREAARANMVAEVKKQLDTYTAKHGLKGYDFTDNMRLEEAYDKLLESNTPFVVEALDIGNLGGLNTALDNNHEAADEHLRGVFGDIYIDTVNRLGGIIGKFGGDEFVTLWVGYDNAEEVRGIRDTIEKKLLAERDVRELGEIAYPKGNNLPTGALHTASGFINGRKGVPFTVARAAAEAGAEKKKESYNENIKKRLENLNNLPYNYNKGGTQNEHRSETQTVGNTGRNARGRVDELSSQDNSQNISGGLRGVDKGRGRVLPGLLRQQGTPDSDGVTESATAPLSQEARAELNNLSPEVQNELRKRGLNFASRETASPKRQGAPLNNRAENAESDVSESADIDKSTDADAENESPADRDIRDILEAEFGAALPVGSVQISGARFAPWIHDVVKKVFNIDIVVVDADHDAIADVSPTGDSFDGFYSAKTPDKIYIASDTKRPLFQVISHELWHSLERNADLKAQVEAALRLTSAGRRAMLREGSSEFTADYVFGKALEDRAFWRHLAAKNIVERFARDTIDALRRLYVAMKRASEDVDRATTGRHMTTGEFEDREGIGDHLMNMRELFDQLSRAIKEAKGETGTAQAAAVAERFRAITGGAVVGAGGAEAEDSKSTKFALTNKNLFGEEYAQKGEQQELGLDGGEAANQKNALPKHYDTERQKTFDKEFIETHIGGDLFGMDVGKSSVESILATQPKLQKTYLKEWNAEFNPQRQTPKGKQSGSAGEQFDLFGSAVEAGVPAEHLDKYPNARKRARELWDEKGTRSPFFKKWFGDWEKDPEGASQMVDKNGAPKVFYHNSPNKFNVYDKGKIGSNNDAGWLGEGFYFYGDEDEGWGYGKNRHAVYLNMRNPYYATEEDNRRLSEENNAEASREFTERLKNEGYDGVYYNGDLRQEAVVFDSNQVKSATDNVGTFDSGNPDIRFARRGGNEAFARELDKWNGTDKITFTVGSTSEPLKSIGVKDRKIVWHSGKIEEILNKHKGMTRNIIKQVPNILENPIIVLKSKNADTRIAVFGEVYDANGAPVTAILELLPTGSSGRVLDVNIIASAYGKDSNPAEFIRNSEVLYITEDKKKAADWFQGIRLQLPSYKTSHGSIGNITYSGEKINISGVLFSDLNKKPTADRGRELSRLSSGVLQPNGAQGYHDNSKDERGAKSALNNKISDSAPKVNRENEKNKKISPDARAREIVREASVKFAKREGVQVDGILGRLPLTTSFLELPDMKAMRGKQVKAASVEQNLNRKGVKEIEKELVRETLAQFKEQYGDGRFDYNEFEGAVRMGIVPLRRIETETYSDYGADNVWGGDNDYIEDYKTVVLNFPGVDHGETGHFGGDYGRGGKAVKYIPKQLNDNTWVAVDEKYSTEATQENIERYVATAGSEKSVKNWIEKHSSGAGGGGAGRLNSGLFGHFRVWMGEDMGDDSRNAYIAELQSDYFQKHSAKKELAGKSQERNLTAEERQFAASQKTWGRRLLHEAVRYAAEQGADTVYFPAPYTAALVEGYIEPEWASARGSDEDDYQIVDRRKPEYDESMALALVEGDIIESLFGRFIVVEAAVNDDTFTAWALDDAEGLSVEEFADRLTRDYESDLADGGIKLSPDKRLEFYENMKRNIGLPGVYRYNDSSAAILGADGEVYAFAREPDGGSTFNQVKGPVTADTFNIESLPKDQQRVLEKYEAYRNQLETDFEGVQTSGEWYGVPVEENLGKPIVAFAKRRGGNDTFARQLQKWKAGKMGVDEHFDLGVTPKSIQRFGAKNLPLVMTQNVLTKITMDKHNIDIKDVARLPEQLADPIMLFRGSKPDSFVVLTELRDKSGREVVVAIHLNKEEKRLKVNRIASAYGKDWLDNYVEGQINKNNLLDANKEKASEWFTNRGLQLPKLVQTLTDASDNKISDSSGKVNRENEKNQKSSSDNRAARYSPADDPAPITPRQFRRLLDRLGRTGLAKDVITDADEMRKRLSRTFGEGAADRFMSVWHGSPHAFDKFSTAFMGSGEGNQSYGWGLYFTDVREIARGYGEQQGTRQYPVILNGKKYEPDAYGKHPASRVAFRITWHGGYVDTARKYVADQVSTYTELAAEKERKIAKITRDDSFVLANLRNDLQYYKKRLADITAMLQVFDAKGFAVDDRAGSLYNVKIHGDKTVDDLNFIRWDKPLTDKQRTAIINGLMKLKRDKAGYEDLELDNGSIDANIDDIRENTEYVGDIIYGNLSGLFGNQKAASEFLLRAGIDGIQYPTGYLSKGTHEDSYNYVVFDDKALEIVEHIRLMSTPDGEVYGFATKDGKIYLDPAKMNANTPIHEYGHLWIDFVKKHNNPLYKRIVYAAAQSEFYKELKANPAYAHLSHTERAEEATARAIADAGEVRFLSERADARFRQFLRELWDWVAAQFGITARGSVRMDAGGVGNMTLPDMDAAFVGNMTLEELAEGAARELLGGREIGEAENGGAGGENYISGDDLERAGQEEVIKEYTPNEKTIQKSRESLAHTPAVADLTGNEFEKGEKNLFEQVSDYFDRVGNNVYNDELGDISLNRRSARDDIAHGVGRLKAITFAAVPDILKSGEVISFTKNHKGRGYDTAIIAAPVNIKGDRHYVAAVVNRSSVKSGQIDTQRFYLHEVYSDKKASELFKTVWRFLQDVGHGSSEAINNKISDFSENVNSKIKKSKNIFAGEDEDSDGLRFARRTVSPAERERRAKDPRWQIMGALGGILKRNGIFSLDMAIEEWGHFPDWVKDNDKNRGMWQKRWDRSAGAFTSYARNNPHLFAEVGFSEAFDTERGLEDRFDMDDVLFKMRDWRNDFDSGKYHIAEEDAPDDSLIVGMRAAAFDSLTEGLAPHERELQYWDGYYVVPELEHAELDKLAKGKDQLITFTNAGEEFTATRDKNGEWIVRDTHGRSENMGANAKVWVDKGHLQTAERYNAALRAEADVERAQAEDKFAKNVHGKVRKKKAEAEKAAEAAKAEVGKAMYKKQKAAEQAKNAKSQSEWEAAEKAKAEAEAARVEMEKRREAIEAQLKEIEEDDAKAREAAKKAAEKLREKRNAAKKLKREMTEEVAEMLAYEMRRVTGIRGKRASTLSADANRYIMNIIRLTGKDFSGKAYEEIQKQINYYMGQGVGDIKENREALFGDDDTQKWMETPGGIPAYLHRKIVALYTSAIEDTLTTKNLVELMEEWKKTRAEGTRVKKMQLYDDKAERHRNVRKQTKRMGVTVGAESEFFDSHSNKRQDRERKNEKVGANTGNWFTKLHWENIRPERIFAWFDGTLGKKDGLDDASLLTNLVYNPIMESADANMRGIARGISLIQRLGADYDVDVVAARKDRMVTVDMKRSDRYDLLEDANTSANEQFNDELQQQIAGTLPAGHVYNLGRAGKILQSAGIPDLDIELNAARLRDKSEQANHPFSLANMMNLPKAIQEPLAVFDSTTQPGSFVILTELKHGKVNYVVALQANRQAGNLLINSIRSIHPRDSRQVANWVKKGLLKYADKKGMADWISKQRCNSADVENPFSQAKTIIDSFENPELATGQASKQRFDSAEVGGNSDRTNNKISDSEEKVNTQDEKTLISSKNLGTKPKDITYANAMFVYAHSQNKDGRLHLVGSGYTEDNADGNPGTITQIVDALPQNYKDYVDALIDYLDEEQFKRVNEVFEREHGVSMTKVVRYFFIRNLDSGTATVQEIIEGENNARASVRKGMTKDRIVSTRPFNNEDFFTVAVEGILDAEKYIAYNDAIRNANKYIMYEPLASAMKAKSEQAYDQIKQWIKDVASPKSDAMDTTEGAFRFIARNYTVAVLGGNLLTMMKQPISVIHAIPYVSPVQMTAATLNYAKNPIAAHKFVTEKSAMMRNRAESIEQVFADMAKRGELNKILKIRLSRKMSVRENAKQVLDLTQAFAMKGIQAMDSATAGVVWRAKYDEIMNKTLKQRTVIIESKNKTDAEKKEILQKMEAVAIRAADALVRKTQSMGGDLHVSGSFRAKSFVARTFTMFMNDANQNYNLLFEVFAGAKNRHWAETAALAFVHGVAPAVVMGIVSSGPAPLPDEPEDPEEWWKWFKKSVKWDEPEDYIEWLADTWFGGIPLWGAVPKVPANVGANIIRELRGREWQVSNVNIGTSPVQSLGEDVEQIVNVLRLSLKNKNAATDAKERKRIEDAQNKIIEQSVRLAFALRGIPGYVPYNRFYKGVYKDGDWRRAAWSKYALTDKSVEAAMAKRADKDILTDEYKRFDKYYDNLNKKRWYDRDPKDANALTPGEKRQAAFDDYYDKALDKRANADELEEFRLIKKSGIYNYDENGEPVKRKSPPSSQLVRWVRNRTARWPYEKDVEGNPVLDEYDNMIYPKWHRYYEWKAAQKAKQDSTKVEKEAQAWEYYNKRIEDWEKRAKKGGTAAKK